MICLSIRINLVSSYYPDLKVSRTKIKIEQFLKQDEP